VFQHHPSCLCALQREARKLEKGAEKTLHKTFSMWRINHVHKLADGAKTFQHVP
jgi:hypothetical protein